MSEDVRPALRAMLETLGFTAMARDVATETDWARLQRYARIILKQWPQEQRQAIRARFAVLRLV